MSVTIQTSFVNQYNANLEMLCQQMGSKLRGAVGVEKVKGECAYFEQLGSVEAVKAGARVTTSGATYHTDTPITDMPYSRRRVDMATWRLADLIENDDKVRMLIDPTSQVAQSFAMGMGRAFDAELLRASLGKAKTGHDGSTEVDLPAGNVIDTDAANVFNVDKLIEAKIFLDSKDAPEEDRFIAVQAKDLKNLLKDQKATSVDYAAVKALVQGEIDTFMGFKFIRVSDKVWSSAGIDDNVAVAFHRNGLKLGIAQDIISHIDPRPDKNYATQVYSEVNFGATRMNEDLVVKVVNKA